MNRIINTMSNENKKKINFFGIIGIGLTVVVGSGIWRDPLSWTDMIGPLSLVAILISWLLFFTSGLAYAEVVSMFPKSGGPYSYVSGAINKKWGVFLGLLYYLGYMIIGSLLAFLSANFTLGIFNVDSNIGLILLTAGYTILLCFLSGISSPKIISIIALIWVAIKIVLLLIVAIFSIVNMDKANLSTTGVTFSDFNGVLNNSLWALMGFEVILIFAEEVDTEDKKIKGNLRVPKALLYSLIIVVVLYLIMTFAAASICGIGSLEGGTISQFELMSREIGISAQILSLFAAFSSLGTTFAIFAMLMHLIEVMAKEKSLPAMFQEEKKGIFAYNVPIIIITTLLGVIIGVLMTSLLNVTAGNIINIFVVIGLGFVLISALIPAGIIGLYLRIKMPILERPFKTPVYYIVFPLSILLGLYLLFLNISGLF